MMRAIWLRKRFPWMGEHSGYDMLFRNLEQRRAPQARSFWPGPDLSMALRLLERVGVERPDSPYHSPNSVLQEFRAWLAANRHRANIIHLAYLEEQYWLLGKLPRPRGARLVATVHQTDHWWRVVHGAPETIGYLDGLIALTRREQVFFDEYLPGRVWWVPHGVDTRFFSPEPGAPAGEISSKCLTTGFHMRDFKVLGEVIERTLSAHSRTRFEIILPPHVVSRAAERIGPSVHGANVVLRSGLSDSELLDAYRSASVLVQPYYECAASNAILEAMSTGLPIVSTALASLREYCEPGFSALTPAGDGAAMAGALCRLLEDRGERVRRGELARRHAAERFSLDAVAQRTLMVYEAICRGTGQAVEASCSHARSDGN